MYCWDFGLSCVETISIVGTCIERTKIGIDMSYKIRVKNKEISSLKDWENAFNGGKLWKKGRSAYSLADFMLNRNGIKTITEILDRCGFCGIQFLSCDVEASVKFDEYSRTSQRDMILIGELENREKVFITVEAKVDESFGGTIGCSKIDQKSNRVEGLINKFILHFKESDKKLRYQLLHATAATIEKGSYGKAFQKSIMLTLVFKTKGYGKDVDYDRNKGDRNFEDFCDFMQAIGANREGQSNVWNLNFKGQEITFIYADIEFQNLYAENQLSDM